METKKELRRMEASTKATKKQKKIQWQLRWSIHTLHSLDFVSCECAPGDS